jgi:hypothetical protein
MEEEIKTEESQTVSEETEDTTLNTEVGKDESLQSEEETKDDSGEQKQVSSENLIPKERLDKMMSKYQSLLAENRKLKQPQTQASSTDEDKWITYLADRLEQAQLAKQQAAESAAQQELDDVSEFNPDIDKTEILNTAIKYGVTLAVAADIVRDVKTKTNTSKTITADEAARKSRAGRIAGKPSGTSKQIMSAYDPKLSLEENIRKGAEELGLSQ